jgi:hypothetical protein
MKVLFLDIDGVCNSETAIHNGDVKLKGSKANHIDAYMAFLVGKIKLDTACEVVLSSSWRHSEDDIKFINERVVKLLDRTPFSGECNSGGVRGKEIQAWLDAHPDVTHYAILDDDSDMLETQKSNFFQTTWKDGLTTEIAYKVIDHLNKKRK